VSTTRSNRHIAAERSSIYQALLDPDAVQRWMVPDGMASEIHAFDAREGGTFRISLTYDDPTRSGKTDAATDTFHGRFVRLVPDAEVVQAVEFETDDPAMQGEMTITYRLDDAPAGGTIVTGIHEGVPPGVRPEDNELGWQMSMAKLAALVEPGRGSAPTARER
jgi:uncharacterized protein YndB with AHSA1/START domain